jgi:hypothetical protein
MSECTISSGSFSQYDLPTRNDSLCFFPKMQLSYILYVFLINEKPFTMSFVCSSFRPPKFKCPNMKFHSQESSCTSDWNVSCIFAPFSPFLILCALFYSLELHALSVVNAMSNCAPFSLPIACVVFLFLVGFNVNGNILLLVI